MIRGLKSGAIAVALFSLCGELAGEIPARAADQTTGPGIMFAQAHSDLLPDPAVRFGRLSNGLTYVIRVNPTPAGEAVVEMRIDGGYLAEAEDEQGMTYLINRLAFDGTKDIPGNLNAYLASNGLDMVLGRDATFDTDATRYTLELPDADKSGLDKGLFILRQIAGDLPLTDNHIHDEAVTIANQDTANNGSFKHTYDDIRKWYFPGQAFSYRDPTGSPEVMLYSEPARVRAFYRSRYRPENTTVTLVGDFDPDIAEQRLKAAFSKWKSEAPLPATPDYGLYKPQAPRASLITYPGIPDMVVFGWSQPLDEQYQTRAMTLATLRQDIVVQILGDRLAHQAVRPGSHILDPHFGPSRVGHTALSFNLFFKPRPGEAENAMIEAATLVQQMRAYGVQQSEIDHAYAQLLHDGETAVASSAGRPSAEWLREMSLTIDRQAVIQSPEQKLALYRTVQPDMTPESLVPVIDEIFAHDGPSIVFMGETFGALDEKKVLADYKTVAESKPAPPEIAERTPWPYTHFGTPTAVVKREILQASGVTHLVYGNGLNVYLKPRSDVAGNVHVRLTIDGGLSRFPPDTQAPLYITHLSPFYTGGLGKAGFEEVASQLSNRSATLSMNISDHSIYLAGDTTRSDQGFQMQVLMAYMTDYRPSETDFARARESLDEYFTSLSNNMKTIRTEQVNRFLHNNDNRYAPGDPQKATALNRQTVQSLFDTLLAPAPLTLTIAGDYNPATIEADIGETFGSLPTLPTSAGAAKDATSFSFPAVGTDKTFRYRSNNGQSLLVMAWPTTDRYSNFKTSLGLEVLRRLMNTRFYAAHKQDYGMSTDQFFESAQSDDAPGYGYMYVDMPSYIPDETSLYDHIAALFADLSLKPVTAEELDIARQAVIRDHDRKLRENYMWTSAMTAFDKPGIADAFANYDAMVAAVTAADLRALAQTYLKPGNINRIRILPLDDGGRAS